MKERVKEKTFLYLKYKTEYLKKCEKEKKLSKYKTGNKKCKDIHLESQNSHNSVRIIYSLSFKNIFLNKKVRVITSYSKNN